VHPQAQARAAEAGERAAAAQERCARLEAMLRRASSVKATLETKVCALYLAVLQTAGVLPHKSETCLVDLATISCESCLSYDVNCNPAGSGAAATRGRQP